MNSKSLKVSVVMATYNGEKHIREQIDSILEQLTDEDELIISDDGSHDSTLRIIKAYNDKRIKLLEGPQRGINKNFEHGIINTKNDLIFLCDQDDIWEKDKVRKSIKYFEMNTDAVLIRHNASIIDENGKVIYEDLFKIKNISQKNSKIISSLISNKYQGCTMVFKKELIDKFIPIPSDFYLFDLWIGIIAHLYGKVLFIDDKLIKYRRYSDNVSSFYKRDSLGIIISRRIVNFYRYFIYLIKYRKGK